MSDTMKLLHPEEKQGATIRVDKYEVIKDEILKIVKQNGEIAYKELTNVVKENLAETFEGSITWYVTAVKLDLEARGILERFKSGGLQHLKLVD
ncbi:DUF6958 family protein [Salinibacillus xinjiangensis]|uniref:Uncharacterized protein n=1 Tax=Salinibacillus xinjiangensis TaxID=1229268 RepID=A0A6G1X406_9BACI|nr:hypothetical protein [Salinibacillus xinjiangensis]MRG85682.1 hypothetical protein [Salinibacillus xinjiangensis]